MQFCTVKPGAGSSGKGSTNLSQASPDSSSTSTDTANELELKERTIKLLNAKMKMIEESSQAYQEVLLLVHTGRLEEAEEILAEIVTSPICNCKTGTRDSKDLSIQRIRRLLFKLYGQVLQQRGKLKQSSEWLKQALELTPDSSLLWWTLGQNAKLEGNLIGQKACLERCFKANPKLYAAELENVLNLLGNERELLSFGLKRNDLFLKPLPVIESEVGEISLPQSNPINCSLRANETLKDLLGKIGDLIGGKNFNTPNPLIKFTLKMNEDSNASSFAQSNSSQRLSQSANSSYSTRPKKIALPADEMFSSFVGCLTEKFTGQEILSLDSSPLSPLSPQAQPCVQLIGTAGWLGEFYYFDFLCLFFDWLLVKNDFSRQQFTSKASEVDFYLLCKLLLQVIELVPDLADWLCVFLFDCFLDTIGSASDKKQLESSFYFSNLFVQFYHRVARKSPMLCLCNAYLNNALGTLQEPGLEREFHFVNSKHLNPISKAILYKLDSGIKMEKEIHEKILKPYITVGCIPLESFLDAGKREFFLLKRFKFVLYWLELQVQFKKVNSAAVTDLMVQILSDCDFCEGDKVASHFIGLSFDSLYNYLVRNLLETPRALVALLLARISTLNFTDSKGFFLKMLPLVLLGEGFQVDGQLLEQIHSFLFANALCHADEGRIMGLLCHFSGGRSDFFSCLFGIPSITSTLVHCNENPCEIGRFLLKTQPEILRLLLISLSKGIKGEAFDHSSKEARRIFSYFTTNLLPLLNGNRVLEHSRALLNFSLTSKQPFNIQSFLAASKQISKLFGTIGKMQKSLSSSKKGPHNFAECLKFFEWAVCFAPRSTEAWNNLESIYHQSALSYSLQPASYTVENVEFICSLVLKSFTIASRQKAWNNTCGEGSLRIESRILNMNLFSFLSKLASKEDSRISNYTFHQISHLRVGNKWKFAYWKAKSLERTNLQLSLLFYIQSWNLMQAIDSERTCDPQYKIIATLYKLHKKDKLTLEQCEGILQECSLITAPQAPSLNPMESFLSALTTLKEVTDKKKKIEHRSLYLSSKILLLDLKRPQESKSKLEGLITCKKGKIIFNIWKTEMELPFKHYRYGEKCIILYWEVLLQCREVDLAVELWNTVDSQIVFSVERVRSKCIEVLKGTLVDEEQMLEAILERLNL